MYGTPMMEFCVTIERKEVSLNVLAYNDVYYILREKNRLKINMHHKSLVRKDILICRYS